MKDHITAEVIATLQTSGYHQVLWSLHLLVEKGKLSSVLQSEPRQQPLP